MTGYQAANERLIAAFANGGPGSGSWEGPGDPRFEWAGPVGSGKHQTDSPKFKEWFGDSKVVDKDGKPLVVYHGTASSNITEFSRDPKVLEFFRKTQEANEPFGYMNFRGGTFFAPDPKIASSYASQEYDASVYPVYVKAENPVLWYGPNDKRNTGTNPNKTPDALFVMGEKGIEEIAIIDPTQIKSIFNRGTWSKTDPDISNTRFDDWRTLQALNVDEEEGVWRTIRGTPVFIKEGQDVGDAIKEKFGESKKPFGQPKKTLQIEPAQLAEETKQWRDELSENDMRGIKGYAGTSDAFLINRALRAGQTPASALQKETVAHMTRLLEKSKLHTDVKAFRGLKAGPDSDALFDSFKRNVGGTVEDRGFVSTTIDKAYAKKWGGKSGVIVNITIPKGAKAAYLHDLSGRNEFEVVMQRGSRFRIISVKEGPMRQVNLEYHGSN